MDEQIHSRIRRFRENLGLTQEEIADELGIGRTTYINFEKGNISLHCRTLRLLAEFANVSEEQILYGRNISEESLLCDDRDFEQEKRALIEEYEQRIASLNATISELRSSQKDKDELIKSQMKTIEYLLKDK